MTCWLMLLLYKQVVVLCQVTRLDDVIVAVVAVKVVEVLKLVEAMVVVVLVLNEMEVVLYHK